MSECSECQGHGEVQVWETCKACNGTGEGPELDPSGNDNE